MVRSEIFLFFTSTTFQLIVVAMAVVAMAAMFVFRKQNADAQPARLHTYYICGILLFLIIELVTYIVMQNGRSTDIISAISLASSIASLIMSVLAIIVTIQYGSDGRAQAEILMDTSKKIDGASEEIKQTADEMSRLQGVIKCTLEEMNAHLGNIDRRTQMQEKQFANSDQPQSGNDVPVSGEDVVKMFVQQGSPLGNLALFLCCRQFNRNKNDSFSLTNDRISTSDALYLKGYLIAAASINIVHVRIDDRLNVRVLFVDNNLAEELNVYFNGRADNDSVKLYIQSLD